MKKIIIRLIFFGHFFFALTSFSAQRPQIEALNLDKLIIKNDVTNPFPVPEITGIQQWINTPMPIVSSHLKGDVTLIYFWAYSCLYSVKNIQLLNKWYDKYHLRGFNIIGVHTPEFDFETEPANVENAVRKYSIKYPVAIDNNFMTWSSFENQYWPEYYLVNKNGDVVYMYNGEFSENVVENNIRYLIGLKELIGNESLCNFKKKSVTQETYLGSLRSKNFSNPNFGTNAENEKHEFRGDLKENFWGLRGNWNISPNKISSMHSNAALIINFQGKNVFAVMGSQTKKTIKVKIKVNGEFHENQYGKDVTKGFVKVSNYTLYNLVSHSQNGFKSLELIASEPGLDIFTLNFQN